MVRALAIWLFATAVGALLVAILPEGGQSPVVAFSPRHGPSGADLVGITLALAGWAIFIGALARCWHRLEPRWPAWVLLGVTVAGTAICVSAISADLDSLAASAALAAFAAQLALAVWGIATEPRRRDSGIHSKRESER